MNYYQTLTRQGIFALCLLFCFTPYSSPPIALAIGLALALTIGHPWKKYNGKATKYLLQISVVGLGFGLNFGDVIKAGKTGVMFTVVSIFGTLALGYLTGKLLAVSKNISRLISAGTAICGGSAIAALAPIINADEHEISVSLGTVFILNSIALFIFPAIGHFFALSQNQFGVWSAIAIHDTSSVVGTASRYGHEALQVATTVKLTRALWIVPLSLIAAIVYKNKTAKVSPPYFILFFLLASIAVTLLPSFNHIYSYLVHFAKIGLTITLFLIGAGLSRETLKTVGIKPVLLGAILWIIISVAALIAVKGIV
jgi:uncharacterized integral membrane protein (TIGR00698 family)